MRLVLAFLISALAGPLAAKDLQTVYLAGGCFWCVEADMDKVAGVVSTTSGFTGGHVKNPTYKQVTKGDTGHYEVVRVVFDADKVSFPALIDAFWRSIDPLDAGGQFCDRGDPYRTAIFVTSPAQRKVAEASRKQVAAALGRPVATVVLDAGAFTKADAYHQDYYLSDKVQIFTRWGPLPRREAYKRYRAGCGRDARVRAIWGSNAFPPGS